MAGIIKITFDNGDTFEEDVDPCGSGHRVEEYIADAQAEGIYRIELWADANDADAEYVWQSPEALADAREWRQERAMQAGMAFGCQGYNDAMGY